MTRYFDGEFQMLPVSLRIECDGKITVYLRNAATASEMEDEIGLDVDHAGHWIGGIEILGSVGFDLASAVRPFNPKSTLESGKVGVTYDPEANAAFFYMPMKGPASIAAEGPEIRYSYSITPVARFGLDEQYGLVWVRFLPDEANESPEDFLALVDARVEKTTGR